MNALQTQTIKNLTNIMINLIMKNRISKRTQKLIMN